MIVNYNENDNNNENGIVNENENESGIGNGNQNEDENVNVNEDENENGNDNDNEDENGNVNEVDNDNENENENEDGNGDDVAEPSIEELIDKAAKEENTASPSSFSLRNALGGSLLLAVLKNQIACVAVVVVTILASITIRYQNQKLMINADKLEKKIEQERYKSSVYAGILTEKSRISNIRNALKEIGDTTLKVSLEPPYKINAPEE